MTARTAKGFTLLELMIVIVVIGVLAALALFNYNKYGFRARRSDGQQFLMAIAAAEERYFTSFNVYTANITGASPAGLAFNSATSPNLYYTAAVVLGAGNTSYTITGTPQAGQTADACGALTLDNLGNKTPTPSQMPQNSNGNCWQ
ncbi:MAG: type IV pilin protein [Rudaea sp.]|nr:type IV pilin protein [Rudaea sp.]